MKKTPTIIGLALIDLGIFLVTITFLPKRGSWSHDSPISYFINARRDWDLAWGVLVAAVLISIGVFKLIEATGAFEGKTPRNK